MSQRQDFVEAWARGHWHPTELCARFGISRKTGHKWWHRYEAGGLAALVDQSRHPDRSPSALDAALGALLIRTRQAHPTWGPRKPDDVMTVGADSGSVPVPYLQSPFSEREPWLSPDRKLLAFTPNESGGDQVWMRDFPVPQGKWNLSHGIGRVPRWSPDGRYVYFWRGRNPLDSLFRVRIDRAPAVVVHAPEPVVAIDAAGLTNWDIHPDGRRFVVAVPDAAPTATPGAAPQSRYLIHQNWFGELRRLTGGKPR